MEKNNQYLGTEPLGKLLFKLAVPSVVAQIINMLYNIVDRIYIGHMPEGGSLALTGLGVCMPIIMVVSAFAALVSMGRRSAGIHRHGPRRQQRRRAHTRQLLYIADNNIGYTHLGAPDMG